MDTPANESSKWKNLDKIHILQGGEPPLHCVFGLELQGHPLPLHALPLHLWGGALQPPQEHTYFDIMSTFQHYVNIYTPYVHPRPRTLCPLQLASVPPEHCNWYPLSALSVLNILLGNVVSLTEYPIHSVHGAIFSMRIYYNNVFPQNSFKLLNITWLNPTCSNGTFVLIIAINWSKRLIISCYKTAKICSHGPAG